MKRTAILLWFFSSSFFLWLYNLAAPKHSDFLNSPFSIFDSFFHFSVMLLGAGWCYHFMTLLYASPFDDNNRTLWMTMLKKLLVMSLLLVSVPVVVIFSGEYIVTSWSYLVSYLWVIFGMIGSLVMHLSVKSDFDELISNT
ncbi:hypothetical protein [Zobellella sp. An-6]|uniref:hypothetical protein n=1 Tax=Zobellella sp. An-6 TaxID=3400218 RepID=UPI0040421FA4